MYEFDGGSGGHNRGRTRRVIDVNALNNWRHEGVSGLGSSMTAEYEFDL